MRLQNKVILVTGGAGGIGGDISHLFAGEGARVIVTDVKESQGGRLVERIREKGGTADFVYLDVIQEPDWKAAIGFAQKMHDRLDVLVNNAGISIRKPLEEYPVDMWDRMMAVNVKGVFLGIKHAIPILRQAGGGSIINMSSIAGLVGHQHSSEVYIATHENRLIQRDNLGLLM